jgi:hypothetical protein
MRLATPSTGLLAVALATAGLTVPLVAAGAASAAPAACLAGPTIQISEHERVFYKVGGTKISFNHPGTHTVEITKASTLSARYNTTDAEDQVAIRKLVQAKWTKTRTSVPVTKGHKVKFDSSKSQRFTVQYASRGDRVKWTKLDVAADCTTKVLDTGHAKFPRNNLDWLFAVSQP